MADWRVEFFGPLRLFLNGEPFQLRTRHQLLLLARLAAHAPKPLPREETAMLLWPESSRQQAFAYLRRAVMEMKRVDLEIESNRETLSLPTDTVNTDLDELRNNQTKNVIEGIDHPIADEIRAMVKERIAALGDEVIPPERDDREHIYAAVGEELIDKMPDVAMDLLEGFGPILADGYSAVETLELLTRVLETSSPDHPARPRVLTLASVMASVQTRYSLAERLVEESAEVAERQGNVIAQASALSRLAFTRFERREFDGVLALAQKGADLALPTGDKLAISLTHSHLGGIKWHLMDFEGAVRDYIVSIDNAEREGNRFVGTANLLIMPALYGVPIPDEYFPTDVPMKTTGYMGLAETYMTFMLRFHDGQYEDAAKSGLDMLRWTIENAAERFSCVAVDFVACAVGKYAPERGVALARIGSRMRRDIHHPRSPAEHYAIIRHVPRPYFGAAIEARCQECPVEDIAETVKFVSRQT